MELVTFTAARTSTPHLGAFIEGAPFTICRTSASGLVERDETHARTCQTCDRGAAVLRSTVLRPEVRLLATARGAKAMGHFLIEGQSIAYCGVQLGEGVPTETRVCKVCERLRVLVADFSQARWSERCGYSVEADAPIACNDCEWVGRYVEDSAQGKAEWNTHFYDECTAFDDGEADEVETGEATLAAEDVVATWREEWITEGQQAIEGLLDEQGALFA